MCHSFISGISLLGIPTEFYVYGTPYGFHIIGATVMSFIICYTFIPVLYELKLTSAYEVKNYLFRPCQFFTIFLLFCSICRFLCIILQYLEIRYDKRLRVFGSVLFFLSLVCVCFTTKQI